MVQHPLFGEVSKNFNEAAALEAYKEFQSDPEYYYTLLQMHAHDVVAEVKYSHPEVIDELITKKFEARKEMVKDAVLSGMINKSMSGGTVDEIVATMDKIQKDVAGYTTWERAANTKEQRRDIRGRFVPMGKTVIDNPNIKSQNPDDLKRLASSYDKVTETRFPNMMPLVPGKKKAKGQAVAGPVPTLTDPEMNAKHSAAYLQVAEALNKIDPGGLVMADVEWVKRTPNPAGGPMIKEEGTTTLVGRTPEDFVRQPDYENGKMLTKINWYMDMDSARGGGYDLLTGAGMNPDTYFNGADMAGRAAAGGGWTVDDKGNQVYGARTGALYNYNARMAASPNKEYGSAGYNRLANTAEMIDSIGGDALSGKAKFALGAAKYVGEHGPEAEKVLGPTARRTAYRYRGVERKPDPKLDRSIAMSVKGATSIEDAREKLIHPTLSDNEKNGRLEQDVEFSPFIRYWQNQLPKKENLNLHIASGAIAPSQGIVFDAKGQVVSQAVGYGDDHYLPFNLKKLSRSNRGEWVRTRTMGGPTTEDIYAALTTGTRSVTVVSHSGVYNVEFDESFRGGRRYNDKAARMVRRYSQLLDTLEAENTTLQEVPSDRQAEIREQAEQLYRGDSPSAARQRNAHFKERMEAEKVEPKPSQERIDDWTAEFGNNIAEQYAERYAGNRNFPDTVSWDQLKAQQSVKAGRLLTDMEAIQALNLSNQYNKFLEFKKSEYRAEQKPLKLNGQGYYFALQALQEQFPYYIKRVEWYPPNEPQSGKDLGYVKRNSLRSANIMEGFWDPEIEGHKGKKFKVGETEFQTGKEQANHTNYQNYANRLAAAPGENEKAKNFKSETPLKANYGGDVGNPTSASSGGSGGADTTNPNSTTESARGAAGYGSLLTSGIPGTGIKMTRGGQTQQTPESFAAIVKLGDALENEMYRSDDGTIKQFGSSGNPKWPTITHWQAHRDEIIAGKEEYIEKAYLDLVNIFEKEPTDQAGGQPSLMGSFVAKHGNVYKNELKANLLRPPKTAYEAVADENMNQNWYLGGQFLPGRKADDYLNAQRDPDVQRFRDRAPLFGSENIFRNQVRAADAALRKFPESGFVYGGVNYYWDDREMFAKTVEDDVYGYLKTKQLNRHEPTIQGPFEAKGEAVPDTPAEAESIGPKKEWKSPRVMDEERRKAAADKFEKEAEVADQLRDRGLIMEPLASTRMGVPSSNGGGSTTISDKDMEWLSQQKVTLKKSHKKMRFTPLRRGNG